MAVFGLLVGASWVLLIHRWHALLVLPSLSPPHRVRLGEMRGRTFVMGMQGLDMMNEVL